MRLVDLMIMSIKETVRDDNKNFTVENFLNGDFDDDTSYETEMNNVMLSINRGISRIVTAGKLPYKHVVLVGDVESDTYDLSEYKDIRNIKSVYIIKNGKIECIGYQLLSKNELYLGYGLDTNIHIIYERQVKNFSINDVYTETNVDGENKKLANDLDLDEAYGISDEMCNYIAYFAKSELFEDSEPDRCKRYLNYFEQFLSEIKVDRTYPHQDHVCPVFKVGR